MKRLSLALALLCAVSVSAQPGPGRTTFREGVFPFDSRTTLTADEALRPIADYAAEYLRCPVRQDHSGDGTVALVLDASGDIPAEGYRLEIAPDHIVVRSGDYGGAFNGVQALFRLLPPAIYGKRGLPEGTVIACAETQDAPRFAFRGMMLDVARTWMDADAVKRYIDLLSYHNINKLHLHLTDDEGWRIEIRSHPELAEVGGFRGGDSPVKAIYGKWFERYGGYYTQEEMRDIVRYAAVRNIEVIPEIDLPGHSRTVGTVHPEIRCAYAADTAATAGYDYRNAWCVAREENYALLGDILGEICGLFPSEYIHIGGDECPTVMWEKCPHCKARMKAEGLRRPRQLQNYATARVEKFLNARKRRLIGWDEILEGDVTPTATIMSWRGAKGGIEAARQGNHAIMAPTTNCYLDYYQTRDTAREPLAIGGYVPVEKVYELDPYEQLTPAEQACILGVQANLWTEYIATWPHAEYMLLPRLSALAEVGWSLDRKDYAGYLHRVRRLARIYDACGYNYARHIFGE